MITFSGKMYNFITRAETDIGDITIGQYVGSEPLEDMPAEVLTISRNDVSFNHANNMARIIEQEAKYTRELRGAWPVIRIYRTSTYYFEWSHNAPSSLKMVTPFRSRMLTNALYWEDNNSWDSGIFSYIWCTLPTISELFDYPASVQVGAIYSGIPYAQNPSNFTLYTSDMMLRVTGFPSYALKDSAGAILAEIGSGRSNKVNNGLSYYYGFTTLLDSPSKNYYVMCIQPAKKNSTTYQFTSFNSSDPYPSNPFLTAREYKGRKWATPWVALKNVTECTFSIPHIPFADDPDTQIKLETCIDVNNIDYDTYAFDFYQILSASGSIPEEPGSDVDPEDIPPEDEPPAPIPPDDQDPYYDPTSDPESPEYDPTKDPESPEYEPTQPHTPYRPPSGPGGGDPQVQPPQEPVPVPEIPPAFVTNNSMFTLFNPSAGDLNSLAAFLWSPQWSIDTFKKIFANPLDCILGLMVMPHLSASTSTKEMAVGNIATGVTMRYFTNQFYDFDCGTFKIEEFYASYLDYAPYTKVNIFLPYIGDQQLDTDEVMNKTIGVKYRFDIATGDCVAFITVDGDVLYSYSGNCASRLPLSGNNWSGMLPAFTGALVAAGSMAAGVPALGAGAALAVTSMKQNISHTGSMAGSPGLMGIQTPYLIITRPRQALPLNQNSYTGYPSFMTESLGSLSGYTEVEACHLEHVPCTAEELEEIERLLKEGVLF